jgi:hypothetical protein
MPIAPEARQLGTFWSWIVNSADLAAITRDILSAHESEATRRGLAIDASIAVSDAELHEHPPDVRLDGRLAEVQLLANLGVRQAAHDQPHDLAFSAGEQVKSAGGAMSGCPGGTPTRMPPGHTRRGPERATTVGVRDQEVASRPWRGRLATRCCRGG